MNDAQQPQEESKRILCGVLGILLGSLAIHKFILGYTKEGIIQIIISVVTCGFGGVSQNPLNRSEFVVRLPVQRVQFHSSPQ